jgi:hypothetical protein
MSVLITVVKDEEDFLKTLDRFDNCIVNSSIELDTCCSSYEQVTF